MQAAKVREEDELLSYYGNFVSTLTSLYAMKFPRPSPSAYLRTGSDQILEQRWPGNKATWKLHKSIVALVNTQLAPENRDGNCMCMIDTLQILISAAGMCYTGTRGNL